MARIRTIKPEFWRHEGLSALPESTHMLAAALLTYSDDHGYFNANPKLIQAECFPLREPLVSVQESLTLLTVEGYIRLGDGPGGRRYGQVVEFSKHQRVAHPTDSKIKELPITWLCSDNPPENFVKPPETFAPEQGTGNREQGTGTGNVEHEAPAARAVPPKAKEPTTKEELIKVLDSVHADAVIAHRKGRGKFTPYAAKLLAGKFAKCADPNAAADAMIANNWQGFEPEWMENRSARAGPAPKPDSYYENLGRKAS